MTTALASIERAQQALKSWSLEQVLADADACLQASIDRRAAMARASVAAQFLFARRSLGQKIRRANERK